MQFTEYPACPRTIVIDFELGMVEAPCRENVTFQADPAALEALRTGGTGEYPS